MRYQMAPRSERGKGNRSARGADSVSRDVLFMLRIGIGRLVQSMGNSRNTSIVESADQRFDLHLGDRWRHRHVVYRDDRAGDQRHAEPWLILRQGRSCGLEQAKSVQRSQIADCQSASIRIDYSLARRCSS